MKGTISLITFVLLVTPAAAQQSAHFQVESGTFHGSGMPLGDSVAQSTHYVLSLGAVGQGVSSTILSGPGHTASGGISGSYPPPVEVANVRFIGPTTLQWDASAFAADYAIYRGAVGYPFDPGFGTCLEPPPLITSNSAPVSGSPASGEAYFYLVTGRNAIALEGTKGENSAGVTRANPAPCP